jgi:hypothetical protein
MFLSRSRRLQKELEHIKSTANPTSDGTHYERTLKESIYDQINDGYVDHRHHPDDPGYYKSLDHYHQTNYQGLRQRDHTTAEYSQLRDGSEGPGANSVSKNGDIYNGGTIQNMEYLDLQGSVHYEGLTGIVRAHNEPGPYQKLGGTNRGHNDKPGPNLPPRLPRADAFPNESVRL